MYVSMNLSIYPSYVCIYLSIYLKLFMSMYFVGDDNRERSDSSRFLHRSVGEGASPFPRLLHFTLDLYLIMLSVKQGGIKYYFITQPGIEPQSPET